MPTPTSDATPSRLYTWFLGPFLAISIGAIVLIMVQDKTATWTPWKAAVLSGFVLLVALVVAAIYWPSNRDLCLRLAATLVVVGVGAHLADTLNTQSLDPSNWPRSRDPASVPKALLACLFFGLPALLFALRGVRKNTDAERLTEIERDLAKLDERDVAGRIGPATDQRSSK